MRKIKKGDEVILLKGKHTGLHGKVLRTLDDGNRVIVENVNLVKKHIKPNPNTKTPGGIVDRESPIHISNVAIYNHVTKKGDKVIFKVLEDGKKVRCFKSNKEWIDV
jgi:large subunit ribosomal protein L24